MRGWLRGGFRLDPLGSGVLLVYDASYLQCCFRIRNPCVNRHVGMQKRGLDPDWFWVGSAWFRPCFAWLLKQKHLDPFGSAFLFLCDAACVPCGFRIRNPRVNRYVGMQKRGWIQVGSGLDPLGSGTVLLGFYSKCTWIRLVLVSFLFVMLQLNYKSKEKPSPV